MLSPEGLESHVGADMIVIEGPLDDLKRNH
jgi:hypothetical protein